jgi:hypothetical protein
MLTGSLGLPSVDRTVTPQQRLGDGIIGEGHGVAPLVVLFEPDLGLSGIGLLQRGIPARQHRIQPVHEEAAPEGAHTESLLLMWIRCSR